jgi:hypothetical protein
MLVVGLLSSSHLSLPGACAFLWLQATALRMAANTVILAGGLLLQCALVWVLFVRGIARRFPGFTALLVFYPLRAAALFALARFLDADTYDSLFNLLGAVEIPLLAWVCIELTLRLVREAGGWRLRRGAAVLALAAIAVNMAWVALRLAPEKKLADCVQIGVGFLMLELFGVASKISGSKNLVRIPAGFAAFALFQFAALAGRSHALARHSSAEYIGWSYAPACGYLAVVVFWTIALVREA